MDEPPHSFPYYPGVEEDESLGVFVDPATRDHYFQQNGFAAMVPFQEGPNYMTHSPNLTQSQPRIEPSRYDRPSPQLGIDGFGFPPMVSRHNSDLRYTGSQGVEFRSPGLTSGSSTTPETRTSRQNITPDILTHASAQKPQQVNIDSAFPPPTPITPLARRPRSTGSGINDGQTTEHGEASRSRHLERNRMAASKSRQRRKEWMTDLEETREELESRHSHLKMEYGHLLNEVNQIRSQLMSHASCNDPNIDKWIENEAKRYVLGASEQYDAMLANFRPTADTGPRHGSLSDFSGNATPTNDILSPANRGLLSLPERTEVPFPQVFFQGQMPNDNSTDHSSLAHTPYVNIQAPSESDQTRPA